MPFIAHLTFSTASYYYYYYLLQRLKSLFYYCSHPPPRVPAAMIPLNHYNKITVGEPKGRKKDQRHKYANGGVMGWDAAAAQRLLGEARGPL